MEKNSGSTRREFLNYAWLASLGILTVQLAGITVYLSMPRFREGEFGGIIEFGLLSELPEPNNSPVNNAEGKFWLVHTEEGVLALYKVCPHLDCLIHWNEQERTFICPCHGSQFDRDGTYLSGPAPRSLDRFVTQVVSADGTILAETDPQTGDPLPVPDESASEAVSVAQSDSPESDASTPEPGFEDDAAIQVDTGHRVLGQSLPA
jgi:cytochrome b6-f complex iron-sulfur subunit